jgi:ATP-dependent RNA helicase RhlE
MVRAFQAGEIRILIATDLIARGIDITDITHVINFDLPDHPENYIHRIGRTGRADQNGIAITFIGSKDNAGIEEIQNYMHKTIPIKSLADHVEISTELLEFEKPKTEVAGKILVLPKRDVGPAFHEKLAKNKKVNVRYNHKKAMREKYGKPKKKGAK